ncbi:MAG: hypothetical protein COA65_09010 [Rhodospirillaceae bacterium]|nr:MAG: hypothetical protein COA65_09010 [Rhodospirillaceae bacterium]
MLSKNLTSLVERFVEFKATGVAMGGAEVESLVAILTTAVEDAKALESGQVPANLRLADGDLGNNVVRLAPAHRAIPAVPGDAA